MQGRTICRKLKARRVKTKEHLLLEGKSAILIGVEELDQLVGLSLTHGVVALVSEEVQNFEGAHEGVAVTVKSLEGGVGCEVVEGAEALASCLESLFTCADGDDQVLESVLGFVS